MPPSLTTLLTIAGGVLILRPTPALRWKYLEAFERSALWALTALALSSFEQLGCCCVLLPRCCCCRCCFSSTLFFFSGDRLPAAERMDVMAPCGVEA
jgi:hypothetical protein